MTVLHGNAKDFIHTTREGGSELFRSDPPFQSHTSVWGCSSYKRASPRLLKEGACHAIAKNRAIWGVQQPVRVETVPDGRVHPVCSGPGESNVQGTVSRKVLFLSLGTIQKASARVTGRSEVQGYNAPAL